MPVVLEADERADATNTGGGEGVGSRIDALFVQLNNDALRLQELYYQERRYMAALDDERRGTASNQAPGVVA